MKKMRLALLSGILILSLLLGSTAYAQGEELPAPGITPDSPFYFLDSWGKRIGLLFAFSPEAKARKALEYAAERLAEARAMAAKRKLREIARATAGYDEFLALASQKVAEVAESGAADNVSEIVALATAKHLSVLDSLKESVPEEAREAIIRAKEASLKGQQSALRALAKRKLKRAIEINLATIEKRLSWARAKAAENNPEEVTEALSDAEKLFDFGEQIAEMAQGLGENTTAVEKLVARARSAHLEVLAEVHQKVPEQARPAIENALTNALMKRQRLLEMLKNKGALDKLPEPTPAVEMMPQLRERIEQMLTEQAPEKLREKIREQLTRPRAPAPKPAAPKPTISANVSEEEKPALPKRMPPRKP
ncbi:MAG TPA: hypothetical protein G4O01_02835 [Dehalococcoidia bacterium]|jgi:hypothetical protein|nr:hypothetical protein [Dehalococcoidia bacterium]